MTTTRLEAFSDGVLAIIITIMVLELKVPHSAEISALKPLLPVFMSYILSFITIGIYWSNHHHLMHAVGHVNGKVLWANTHLLFWLSLVPFVTAWMGENHFQKWPVAVYGIILIMAGVAYYILSRSLIHLHGKTSTLAKAIGNDRKGKLSVILYLAGVLLSLVQPWIGYTIYALTTGMWIIPDNRIEKKLT